MESADRFRAGPDTVVEEVDGEVVLLDLAGDRYFAMNPVGRQVWEGLEAGLSFGEIVETTCEEFDVEPGRARSDVTRFLDGLLERGLIEKVSG